MSQPNEQTMETLKNILCFALASLTLAFATTPAHTTNDRVPQQFVGSWCADQTPVDWEGVIYKRSNTCKSAHEPEDHIILQPDRLLVSDAFECKFLEIVSITRHGTHRLKFWCKSKYETWMYEIWISVPERNKLAVQEVSN
jgi:hypothetical protein